MGEQTHPAANGEERERELEARLAALWSTLERFHEEVRADPDRWQDGKAVGQAWGAALEIGSAEHELWNLYVQDANRERARRVNVAQSQGLSGPEEAPAKRIDPVRLHRMRAHEASGTLDHAMAYLRHLTGGKATHYQDLERRARLRWLIDTLATLQPELASEIRATLEGTGRSHTGVPGFVERRERRTTEVLIRLLAPLLEGA